MINLGVILRCFSRTREQVEKQVEEIRQTIVAIRNLLLPSSVYLERIDVVVPTNPQFIDVDCGDTFNALEAHQELRKTDFDVRTTDKDLFSGLVNEAAAIQLNSGCTHFLILSSGCSSLISNENIYAMLDPFDGAKVSGLVLPDPTLGEFIKRGCITNTFAIWDLVSFFTVGGLDLALRNRYKDNRFNTYVRGAGDEAIPITGLEIPTIARLIESYGPCIAPVLPVTGGKWKRPDLQTDPEGYRREESKMRSKAARHSAIAALYGFDLSYIEAGVLSGYPK